MFISYLYMNIQMYWPTKNQNKKVQLMYSVSIEDSD